MIQIQKNNNAVILGASSLVGEEISKNLEKNNFNILKHTFKKKQKDSNFVSCDFSFNSNIDNFLTNKFFINKKIDLLVSCLGGNRGLNNFPLQNDSCLKMKNEDINWIFKINYFINVFFVKKIISHMNNNSNIVFTSSSVISNPRYLGEIGIYASAKAALNEYTLHLANELKSKSVFVNSLSFGNIGENKKQTSVSKISKKVLDIFEKKYKTGEIILVEEN